MAEIFISARDTQCRSAFQRLLQVTTDDIRKAAIEELLDRYKIWSTTVRANHAGLSYVKSADYRLRHSTEIKDNIAAILTRLEANLVDLCNYDLEGPEVYAEDKVDEWSGSEESQNGQEPHNAITWDMSDSEINGAAESDSDRNLGSILQSTNRYHWSDDEASRYDLGVESVTYAIIYLYKIPIRERAS